MSLTFQQQLDILANQARYVENHNNGFISYHFVGANFIGLYNKKQTQSQSINNIIKKTLEPKKPLTVSYDEEEGWKMVYELAELNIGQTYVIEDLIRKQRKFIYKRVVCDDPYDPRPYLINIDDELLFAEQANNTLKQLAKQRNKLIHALNGNIETVKLYPLDEALTDFKNKFIQKNFFYTTDFGDRKDFLPLEKTLNNIALSKIFPEDLTNVFCSLENKYKLELNKGNPFADYLKDFTHAHPLGIFRDKIIEEYKTPIDLLLRECPYCYIDYRLELYNNEYILFYNDNIIDYLPNQYRDYDYCRNCRKDILIARNYEYVGLINAEEKLKFQNMVEQTDNRNSNFSKNIITNTTNFITSIPNILSYEDVMSKLKPINTITSLYNIYNASSAYNALAEVLRLLEIHDLYWSLDTDKLVTCIDCICSLIKNIRDVPDLISQIPGMDRISKVPDTVNQGASTSTQYVEMKEEALFEINEDGLLAKALKFADEFGIDKEMLKSGGPIVALLTTTVASIALIGCGSKINSLSLTSGVSAMVHTMAIECKDWKILLSSLKDTWEYIASSLGKFLGFTYMDDKSANRRELIDRLETLKKDVDTLEEQKELNFTVVNDPNYFDNYLKRFRELEKLLMDMIKCDQNLVSFRLVLDKLKSRIELITNDYISLFNSKCGKQQPTTIYIGSELSGIGKTTFMEWCVEPLSLRYGRALTKYVKGTEDYWSNYVYQDILHWRDFNQKKTNEEHIELINIYDPSPTQLNMSDNDQKGRQFKSRFMFIDSNTLYIRRSAMIDDPNKLDRRRDFLFEAFTQFKSTPNNPTPNSAEEAINNLYLVTLPRVKQDNGSAEFDTEYFTIDGRDILIGSNKMPTQKFDVIIDRLYQHETANNAKYLEKCQRIFEQERQKGLMREETLGPAISQNEAESKKVILLIGAPGTGKTTLARRFNNNIREDGKFKYDEFTIQNTTDEIRKYVLESYDKGDKDVILTANVTDYEPWINSLNTEQRNALLRRCVKIDVKFNVKKQGWFNNYLTNPVLYTKEEVEDPRNKSLYSRMVIFEYEGMNIKITGASRIIEENMKKEFKNVISYNNTPRIKINKDMARNLVEFDMFWRDVDEISKKSIFELMRITKIIRTTLPYTTITKAFSQIVKDVFNNYDLCTDLESGLNQLNSLRIDSPIEFDCVVKLRDEAFFLTTDDDGKLVFCICDDSFEYRVDNNKVLCFFNNEFMWEVEGRIATWYKHIQRNVEMVSIDYTNLTPPSRDLVQYCNYFINFLKTGFAALAIKELCSSKSPKLSEEMYDTYDQSFTQKPTSYQTGAKFNKTSDVKFNNPNSFKLIDETSADAYLNKLPKNRVSYEKKSEFRFGNETSADAYLTKFLNKNKTTIKKRSNFYFNSKVKHGNMENEACLDIQSAQLADQVMNQNFPLFVGNTQVCFAQGFYKNYMLTVGHLSGESKVKIDNNFYATKVIALDELRDLAILRVLSKSISFKDIRKYFQKERVNNSVDGFKATLYVRSDTGNIYEKPITLKEQRILEIKGGKLKDGLLYNVHSLEGNHPIQTQAGFCGSPMLICNSAYPEKILGLHVAADDVHGLTSVVFRSDLEFEEMDEQTCEPQIKEESITVLPFQQAVIEDLELPKGLNHPLKCVGRAGTFKNNKFISNKAYSSNKTQIYPSPFQTDDPQIFEPSILSEHDPRLKVPVYNIIYKGLNKFAKEQKAINIQFLDECVEELTDVLLEGIRRTGMQTKILTWDEVINGCKYYTTSPSLNMGSGVGYPHGFECGGMNHKSEAFIFNIDTFTYSFADNEKGNQIQSDVSSYLDYLKKNEGRTAVIYVAQKKDEVLKIKKIDDCGTRIFEMGPLYHFMVMKQYYGAAQALLTYVNSSIPFKIGINASSHEYTKLHKYLLRTGSLGMNCDYTGFDSSHPKAFLERYHKIYNRIYQETDPNWCQEDDDVRRRLHVQENQPLVLVDDLIIECPGGLMSGGEDTGGKNNIAGNLNMRYAWKVLAYEYCPEKLYKYDDYTTDATFGDDLIKTIHPDVLSWYNPTNIQNVLNEIGFTITSADKETELVIQPLNELTFLKRSFEHVEVNINNVKQKFLVGSLEDNCFLKMLNWCKASKRYKYRRSQSVHYDPSTIGLSALTCLSEASLKGKEVFDRTKKHLINCSNKYSMVLPKLPTFEQAFYETYFCSSFPKVENREIINIPYGSKLHPLYPRNFNFGDRSFVNIMHCYEYTRAKCHQQDEKAEHYYNNPKECKYVYYPNNRRFRPDRLMFKIISSVFQNYDFGTFSSKNKFIVDYAHKYFGFEVNDAITNRYGELLTEFAISKIPKENLQSENKIIDNIFNDIKIKSNYNINCQIAKENIIQDSDLLIEPNLKFNTTTWKTAEITLPCQN